MIEHFYIDDACTKYDYCSLRFITLLDENSCHSICSCLHIFHLIPKKLSFFLILGVLAILLVQFMVKIGSILKIAEKKAKSATRILYDL